MFLHKDCLTECAGRVDLLTEKQTYPALSFGFS